MKKTMKTQIVGLPYAEFDYAAVQALREGAPVRLIREPDNPHDKNAIAVFLESKKIGFIRKADAVVLSSAMLQPNLKIKTNVEFPDTISLSNKSITIAVEIFSATSVPEHRSSIGSEAGIYRINIMTADKCYVGQANNPARRASEHWRDLTLGVHPNRDLQYYWSMYGAKAFRVELVDKAPEGQNPLERQRWLAEREKHWIAKEREAGRSLNVLDGEIVPTSAARAELVREEADKDRRVRERKREIATELEQLDEKINPELAKRRQYKEKIENIDNLIKNHTGILGLFKGYVGHDELERLKVERGKYCEILRHIESICTEIFTQRTSLIKERKSLKTIKQRNRTIERSLLKCGVSRHISRNRFY